MKHMPNIPKNHVCIHRKNLDWIAGKTDCWYKCDLKVDLVRLVVKEDIVAEVDTMMVTVRHKL